ncbi:carbohydrate kinase [Buttiauxella sp. B2]|uniref:FGGY-family carbohydrate kinase n=1 Tax=Buttiauxella sp. B2 TaxID=2587812 RepID=UPI00111F4A56|nr:FGGY-family carbohydrate kinase [Buttiauxella sp. B2]TNV11106.1 carbohydrate kinase [Buttiauxella sp. B2]
MDHRAIILGIDSGTSVVKAVAFDLEGQQLGCASVRNTYYRHIDGSALQCMDKTWQDCALAIRKLGEQIEDLPRRVAAVSVTAQGDGSWFVDTHNRPRGQAWLWLDARAAGTVKNLEQHELALARFQATGTGLNTCQQGAQLAFIESQYPELLDSSDAVMHCKDWLYLNLTGVRATDPSEASFTFGNFRTRRYDETVIEALGLTHRRTLFPEIIEGTEVTHPLTEEAARVTGLLAGTPVCLGYVDMVMTALGAGVFTGDANTACSVIGSTGVHMRAVSNDDVYLNEARTGYVIALPSPGMVTQVQTNMASTLNLDWLLNIVQSLICQFGGQVDHATLLQHIDRWLSESRPGSLMYHPYISLAGERGPFVNPDARASFIGLGYSHGFADMVRAIIEGMGMAARDCYRAMGSAAPEELRLSGGAIRSPQLRQILGACIGAPVRNSTREEAGAAGAAMMAAVAIGVYPSISQCVDTWVTPLLGEREYPDAMLIERYNALDVSYQQSRDLLPPVWRDLQHLLPQQLTPPVSDGTNIAAERSLK